MFSPVTVIEIVEVPAQALIEDGTASQGEGVVRAKRESRRVDSTSLWRVVELELVVCCDVARSACLVV